MQRGGQDINVLQNMAKIEEIAVKTHQIDTAEEGVMISVMIEIEYQK